MKYIDADKLIAELTRMQFDLNAAYRHPQSDSIVRAISLEYDDILSLVDSLQQEYPEVDLEKEIERTYYDGSVTDTSDMDHVDYENIARHFYELGLNARKEDEK